MNTVSSIGCKKARVTQSKPQSRPSHIYISSKFLKKFIVFTEGEKLNKQWNEPLIPDQRSWISVSQILNVCAWSGKICPGFGILLLLCDRYLHQKRETLNGRNVIFPTSSALCSKARGTTYNTLLIWSHNLLLLPLLAVLQLAGHGSHHSSFRRRFQKHDSWPCIFRFPCPSYLNIHFKCFS